MNERQKLIIQIEAEIEWLKTEYNHSKSIAEPGLADSILNTIVRLYELKREVMFG